MKKIHFCFILITLFVGCAEFPKSNFKIDFIVDKEYDKMYIFRMFQGNDPAGLASRAYSMGIDYDFAKEVQDAKNYSQIKPELDELVNIRYNQIGNALQESVLAYAESWEPAIKDFSSVVTEITGYYWFHRKYVCVVSAFHPGVSNWSGNKIIRIYGEKPIEQRRITAHEIVLSHIFQIVRKNYGRSEVDDNSVWKIAEITTVLILDDDRLLKYWGEGYVPPNNWFSRSNYPQLANLENTLRTIYANRNDFDEYIETAIHFAKNSE